MVAEDVLAKTVVKPVTVRFSQSGVSRRAATGDGDDVAIVGTLMIVAGDGARSRPTADNTHVVWMPYSFLSTFAPDLLSATAAQAVASAVTELSESEMLRRDEHWSFEQSQTICVPLANVEKVHRRTNMRGRRTLVMQRVGRAAPESPLGFGEGGSTQFFDTLREIVELQPLVGEGREAWQIVRPAADAGEQPTESGAAASSAPQPQGRGTPTPQDDATPSGKSRSATVTHADPASPAIPRSSSSGKITSAASGSASSPATPASPAAAGGGGRPKSPASEEVAAFKKDVYGQPSSTRRTLLSTMLRGGSKIAEAVTTHLDRLVAESPVDGDERGDSEYDMMEPLQPVESLTPQIVPPSNAPRFGQPLRPSMWNGCFDTDGRLNPANYAAARETAFRGGIDASIRGEVWPFLLGLYPADSTAEDRAHILKAHQEQYHVVKQQWTSVSDEQAECFAAYRERRVGIEKDVARTDRRLPQFASDDSPMLKSLFNVLMTYSFFNFDIGYCQGMSDFLAPILVIYEGDEPMSYAVFKHLMANRCSGNFYNDHRHTMHKQLEHLRVLVQTFVLPLYTHLEHNHAEAMTFAFRWLLVYFKREFPIQVIPTLWDVIFACPFTTQYEIFMCAAVLRAMSKQIIENALGQDDLVRFCNAVQGNMRVEDLVVMTADFYDGIAQQMSFRRKTQAATRPDAGGKATSRQQRPSLTDVIKEYSAPTDKKK